MKIALVILHAEPARGGAERYTSDLAAALAGAGHDVSLLASRFDDAPPGVARVELRAGGLTRTRRYAEFLDALDAHLAASRYDVVHAMLPVRRCDVYHPHAGLAVAAFGGTKKKIEALFAPRRLRFASVERELLHSSKPPVVLALSEYVRRSIREHYPLDDARVPVLFNAVDLARFEPAPTRAARDYVNGLFIGQDFERKGLMQALLAVSMLKEPRLKLTVVGKRDQRFRPPPDAAAQFSFAGEVKDPRPFYRDADFFVLPTKHDPCSLVVLEALAMGVPVISTRFNGACEIMTNGVHGFVLDDPNDVGALAGAMRRMLADDTRARMSRACQELRPRLSYEHHLRTLLGIYDTVNNNR